MRFFMSLALAGAFGTLVNTAVRAADMAFPPMEGASEISEQPVEFGTGWYLRGDAAWARDYAPLIAPYGSPASPPVVGPLATQLNSAPGSINNYSLDFGFGYKFNNWLRADVVYDYRKPIGSSSTGPDNVVCPYGLVPWPSPSGVGPGYLYDPNDTCTLRQTASLSRQDLLLNGYVDFGTWGGVTPYVGAGAGFVRTAASGAANYYENANGALYDPNLTPSGTAAYPTWVDQSGNVCGGGVSTTCTSQPNISFTQQNWNKTFKSVSYQFAWALMGGFSFAITDHLSVDLGYRYLNLGRFTGIESTSSGAQFVKEKQSTREIRAGLRYMIN